MSYTNLNNPANYQLQSFGQDGMRTVSTTQPYVEGEYYRVIVAVEDSTISATSMVGDNLTNIDVYAGTTIYGLFTAITVSVGEVNAYLAGRTDIDDVWAYIRAYGIANGATIEAEQCAKDAIEPLLDKYYAQASLVMVPSLYKTSIVYSERPMTTDGQLTFTRNSNATRVNAGGLVEKVRENLLLQSNQFDTTWGNSATIEVGGQSGYDGSSDAWRIDKTSASGFIYQASSQSGLLTASVYIKAGTLNWATIQISGINNVRTFYDLQNGVLGTSLSNVLDANIEDVGGGWYRCSITYNGLTGNFRIFPADADNDTSGTSGNIYIQDAQLETGDIATDYIATTSAAVSVGPVANLPRLNYPINSDGSVGCPSLLLEPQRTNLALYSEQFDNAAWTKNAVTISANTATSPDGYANADKIEENTTNTSHRISVIFSFTGPITYTASCFLKAAERSIGYLYVGTSAFGGDKIAYFNLANGTIGTTSSGATASIENYGNGWYRCSVTATSISGALSAGFNVGVSQADGVLSYAGTTGSGILAWGAQLEAGSYATSYIPTLGASVTKLADAAYKTGISSLIGQTEGTLFVEVDTAVLGAVFGVFNRRFLTISDGTTSNRIIVLQNFSDDSIGLLVSVGGASQVSIVSAANQSGIKKIAVGYANNDFVMYINGVQIGTDTSGSVPACSRVGVGSYETSDNISNAACPVSQTLLFKTRLTNAQLAELTTL